jgi:hypothetical protein
LFRKVCALPVPLGEADPVAWLEIVDLAIDPDLRPPLEDIDELLEIALGMRPGGAPAGRQQLVVNADGGKAGRGAERRADAEQLVAARVAAIVRLLHLAPMHDTGGAAIIGSHGTSFPRF